MSTSEFNLTENESSSITVIEEAAGSSGASPAVDPQELQQSLDAAQEVIRSIDILAQSSVSAEGVTPAQRPHSQNNANGDATPRSLSEIDQALAEDIDDLLQGEFESIEAVLTEVFDAQAAIVQKLSDEPQGDQSAPQPSKTAARIAFEQQPLPPAEPEPLALEPAAAPFEISGPPGPLLTDYQAEPSEAFDPMPLPAPLPAPAHHAPAPVPVLERRIPETPAHLAPAPNAPVQWTMPVDWRSIAGALLRPIVALLTILNYPLRLVPASLRLMVDWAAISLLFWVPVVWIFVLTVALRASSPWPSDSARPPAHASENPSTPSTDSGQ